MLCARCGSSIRFPVYCGDRFCPTCTLSRRIRTRQRINWILAQIRLPPHYSFKHITLTIPNQPDPHAAVSILIASFRKLRSREAWRRHVKGGIFVIEITGEPGRWHAHVHAIVEATYFPVWVLSQHWQRASPGRVVWITRVSKNRIVNYLTKYVSKSSVIPQHRNDVAAALRGTRLFQPFGSWHGISRKYEYTPRPCHNCGASDWIPRPESPVQPLVHVVLNAARSP